MARKDYPWHIPDIKFGSNLLVNFILLIILVGFYLITGLVYLIIFIVDTIKDSKVKSNEEVAQIDETSKRIEEIESNIAVGKKWLAAIDESKFNCYRCSKELGHIYIGIDESTTLQTWDTVYLYIVNESRIRYKAYVVDVNVPRNDEKYWQGPPPLGPVCKLKLTSMSVGWMLCGPNLRGYDYKLYNIDNMTSPILIKDELLAFIDKHYLTAEI